MGYVSIHPVDETLLIGPIPSIPLGKEDNEWGRREDILLVNHELNFQLVWKPSRGYMNRPLDDLYV